MIHPAVVLFLDAWFLQVFHACLPVPLRIALTIKCVNAVWCCVDRASSCARARCVSGSSITRLMQAPLKASPSWRRGRSGASCVRDRSGAQAPLSNRPSSSAPSPSRIVCRNWKAFGPSAEYSDGDAEYYRLTDRLSQQYGLFAPQPEDVAEKQTPEVQGFGLQLDDNRHRPEFGLTQKQIAALRLGSPTARLPDPVRVQAVIPEPELGCLVAGSG